MSRLDFNGQNLESCPAYVFTFDINMYLFITIVKSVSRTGNSRS